MDVLFSILPKIASFFTAVLVFISSVFSPAFTPLSDRVDTMKSVTEIEDGLYVMDCTYDYNSDALYKNGVNSSLQLILGGVKTIFGNNRGFACSTFNSVTPDGDYLLSRNFDYMDSPALLVRTTPKNGYASISTVSLYFVGYDLTSDFAADNTDDNFLTLLAPYMCLDGINEKGFSIGVLELETDPTFQISLKKNLTTTSMIRVCLDKAANVDEALEIFSSHDMRDLLLDGCKYHFQMSDATGKSAIVEYYKNKMYVISPEHKKGNVTDFQAATNFHLVEGAEDPDGMGQDRYDLIMKELSNKKGVTTEKQAMSILNKVHMKDCDLHGYICSTLWSNVFNTTDKTLSMCCFGNYKKTYKFSVSKPLLKQIG